MPVRNDFAPGEFCWVDLMAADLEAAGAWYGRVFGWSLQMMDGPGDDHPYGFFMQDGAAVGGIGQLSPEMRQHGVPPMWNAYVATQDCAATEAKVKELGATVTVPTMDVPGHGKLAFFLDPEGASFAVWQATSDEATGLLVKDPVSLSWAELMSRDVDRARRFYGDLFGWTFTVLPMEGVEYVVAKVGEQDAAGLMPMQGPQFEGIPAHWMVYFEAADCGQQTDEVEQAGGGVLVPPTPIPVGTFSVVRDPQGAVFSLVTVAHPGG